MGRGRIDGRPVVVGGDDFTVRGGAADASICQKQVHAEQMANELRLPIVRLVDGTGGGGCVKSLEADRRTYVPANPGWECGRRQPGHGAGRGAGPRLGRRPRRGPGGDSHYALMVRDTSQVFVAGPPVVARLGEQVNKEELGGSHIHGVNGTVDDVVATEEEAFARTRRFLSYLPSSGRRAPAAGRAPRRSERRDDWLIDAIPRDRRKVYKVRPIIEAVVDRGSLLEIGAGWGRSAVTGLARLDGWPVGGAGQRSVRLRRRAGPPTRREKVDALRRPRRDVPPAGRAPRRPARLPHRHRGRAGQHHPQGRRGRSPRSTRRRCRCAR